MATYRNYDREIASSPYNTAYVAPPPIGRQPPFLILPGDPMTISTSYQRRRGRRPLNNQELGQIERAQARIRHLLGLGVLPDGLLWLDPTSGLVTLAGRLERPWLARRLHDFQTVAVAL